MLLGNENGNKSLTMRVIWMYVDVRYVEFTLIICQLSCAFSYLRYDRGSLNAWNIFTGLNIIEKLR